LNSALESDDGRWLVSLFHQGLLVAVDPRSGRHEVLLSGLRYPHALRRVSANEYSLADTARGRVLKFRPAHNILNVTSVARGNTNWLQDSCFVGDLLFMLDGDKSRVLVCDHSGQVLRIDQFDEKWRLQELCPLVDDVA
jgi:hypothetical protein